MHTSHLHDANGYAPQGCVPLGPGSIYLFLSSLKRFFGLSGILKSLFKWFSSTTNSFNQSQPGTSK